MLFACQDVCGGLLWVSCVDCCVACFCFFKQKTAYEMRISDWSSDVCSSDLMVQGYHGTGKSTHIEQVAARLKWPCIRVNLDAHIGRIDLVGRSEERRVGKECVSTCRSRWSP